MRQHPYQLGAQSLEIGRQQNGGNAGPRMRHEFPRELRNKREIFVQPPGERDRGLAVAGVNGGEEEPEQRTADRFQGLGHTGAFFEQDASRIALTLQQLGRQRRAHLGGQMRLRVPPNGIARDARALRDGPLRKPGGDCEINLRPCRVIADRAAQPDALLHRAILICSLWPARGPSRRQRSRKNFSIKTISKMTAKSWCGDTAALMSITTSNIIKNTPKS